MQFSKIARKIAGVPCLYSSYTEGKLAWQKEEEKAGGPNVDPHLMNLSDFLPKCAQPEAVTLGGNLSGTPSARYLGSHEHLM